MRSTRSVSFSPAKTGVSQSKISDGAQVEAPPARPLLLGKGDQRMAGALGLAQSRIVEALTQAEGGEHDRTAA